MHKTFSYPEKINIVKAKYIKLKPVPLPRPFKDGTGDIRYASLFGDWMMLYDENGVCGQGPGTRQIEEFFFPYLLREEGRTNMEWREFLYWRIRNHGFQSGYISGIYQIETAFFDILSRRRGLPLHRFLGAEKDWASVYKGGGSVLLSDEELVEDLVRFKEEGYTQTKFKIGYGTDWEKDIRRLEKARRALGDDFGIAVDANQAWDVETSLAFMKAAAPLRPSWFEEPMHAYDMLGLQRLRREMDEAGIPTPIAMGESVRDFHTFEMYANHGVTHLQPGKLASIAEIMAVRDLARERGMALSSGGLSYINAAFGALYREDELIELHQPVNEVLEQYMSLRPETKGGRFYLPDTPGIPMALDFDKLEQDGLVESCRVYYR